MQADGVQPEDVRPYLVDQQLSKQEGAAQSSRLTAAAAAAADGREELELDAEVEVEKEMEVENQHREYREYAEYWPEFPFNEVPWPLEALTTNDASTDIGRASGDDEGHCPRAPPAQRHLRSSLWFGFACFALRCSFSLRYLNC